MAHVATWRRDELLAGDPDGAVGGGAGRGGAAESEAAAFQRECVCVCVCVSSIRARYLVHTWRFFFIFCQKFGSDCASALYQ